MAAPMLDCIIDLLELIYEMEKSEDNVGYFYSPLSHR